MSNGCSECGDEIKAFGWCAYHYQKLYKSHPNYKPRDGYNDRRQHRLYIIWWQRKKDKELCERWLDFQNFIWDVGTKPEGNFLLVKLKNEPFGPTNFKWQEHLKRKEGENKKDWYARKREARIAANPSMESDRNIKRVYGINRDRYNEILQNQNNGCAICQNKETSVDPRTGTLKKLAVDHCHNTGKIRGLLCFRCNGTIGKIGEDLDLLKKIENYLIKHSEV